MKLQDWQKQILKMTQSIELATIFKPKDKKESKKKQTI